MMDKTGNRNPIRYVQIPDSVLVSALWNYYVHNSLRISFIRLIVKAFSTQLYIGHNINNNIDVFTGGSEMWSILRLVFRKP